MAVLGDRNGTSLKGVLIAAMVSDGALFSVFKNGLLRFCGWSFHTRALTVYLALGSVPLRKCLYLWGPLSQAVENWVSRIVGSKALGQV